MCRSLNHRTIGQRVAVGDSQFNNVGAMGLKTEQNVSRALQIGVTGHHKWHQRQSLLTGGLHKDLGNA